MKTCSKCSTEKPLTSDFYHRCSKSGFGFKSACKECRNRDKTKWRNENKDRVNKQARGYYIDNREKCLKYSREWHQINKDRRNKQIADWQKKNPEKVRAKNKRYRERNPEKVKISYEKWRNSLAGQEWYERYKNDPEVKRRRRENDGKYMLTNRHRLILYKREYRKRPEVKESIRAYKQSERGKQSNKRYKHKRRMREKQALATLTLKQWNDCVDYFNHKCCYCGLEKELTQDHFIPVFKGGEYTIKNIIPSCGSCNSSKGSRDFHDWYVKHDFYSKDREVKIIEYLGYKEGRQQMALF